MIGKPITELYRLEGESEKNSINFYFGSDYDIYYNPFNIDTCSDLDKSEFIKNWKPVNLQGVDYKKIKYLKLC